MLYNKKAKFIKKSQTSDGMGGWVDSGLPIVLAELSVLNAPVSAEIALKEYGLVTTTSMKLYTIGVIPELFTYIEFEGKNYKQLQLMDYDPEKIILMELI